MASGARNQQTGRAGEYFVAAELNRRGAFAVTFAGNMPGIDIMASNIKRSRTIYIQIKTRRAGTWQTTIDEGKPCRKKNNEHNFWVFVDISKDESPSYYVVPDWWIRNDIYYTHQAYLAKRFGKRAKSLKSRHHSVPEKRIAQWQGQWDILQIF